MAREISGERAAERVARTAVLRRRIGSILILALAVLAGGAGGLLVLSSGSAQNAPDGATSGSSGGASGAARAVASPQIGGPFRLTSSQGGVLSDSDLKGKPFAIFFGFTRCPEICPTTLWEMSETLRRLGPEGADLRALFVTLDPERDTPETLASYLQSFDPRIVGLSGTPEEIAAVAKAYRVFWRKVPTANGDYTMDHTAVVYLMDAAGAYAGIIGYKDDAATRDRKLRQLIASGGGAG